MARQETIKIIIDHDDASKALSGLDATAQKLKQAFGSIKIGDTAKAVREQATASREASKAAEESAKAQKLASDAEKARYQTVKELENATKAHLQAEKEAANVATAQQKTHTEAARTIQEMAKAHKEVTNAETAEIRQAQLLSRESERQATAMRRLGKDIGQVNKDQAQSIQQMTQWIRTNTDLTNATVTATGAIHNAAGDFQTYNAAITEAGGVTHNYRIAVDQASGSVYQLDKGIKTTALSLTDLSVIFRAIRTVVGFTGIAQSFRSAFSEMKNMSDAMAEYRKVTGATTQEMETLRETAYGVAKAYGESASDVISSAANMARAGYKENSMAMAELATRTKLVGDMTQEAADKFLIAVDAAYKYQGNVEKLTGVLDAANALDNQYATTIEKISDGMTLVASLASTAHVPVEQLMAALGTMTAVTQRSGAETARGLRSIILNVIGDTSTEIEEGVTATEESVKSMTDALIKYGDESVKAAAKAGKIINPMEAIVALQKAWKANQITEEDLYKISNDVAGKRYYNVFTALIQNPEMYNDMLQSIAESMGSAQNEIDILMDSWTRKTEVLRTTWTELVNNSISEGFIKSMIDAATAGLEFAGSLGNLTIMAVGAYEALRSLSTGISNLRTGLQFGGFNIGMGLLGLGITAIGVWKSTYEKNIRDMQEAASKAVSDAVEKTSSVTTLENLVKRYSEIASDGIQEEQGELEKLKTLQDELNGLVGDQAKAIDLVTGNYGDALKALKNLTAEQKKAAIDAQKAALVTAINSWVGSDFNGSAFGSDNTMAATGEALSREEFNRLGQLQYYALEGHYNESFFMNNKYLRFKNGKPTEEQDIIAAYEELLAYRNWLATEIGPNGKSYGQEHPVWYESIGKLLSEMENSVPNIKKARELIDEYDKELESIGGTGGSAEDASKGIDKVTESAYGLADAIDAATSAKEKFDDAMKTSKADAFNDYVKAFQTLQGEIDAGRVNSTAFYASARMMLGDEAYNATGGSTEAVMEALNKKTGGSGSILDAYKILTQSYVDENGKEIEGYGIYQLLSQTQGFNRNLRTAEGMAYIPDLTDEEWRQISKAWSGIDVGMLISVLNAFDQYDKKGYATDKNVQPGTTETKPEEDINKSAEAANEAAEAQNTLAEAEKQQAEAAQEAAEKNSEAANETKDASEQTKEDSEKEIYLREEITETHAEANAEIEKYILTIQTLLESIKKAREKAEEEIQKIKKEWEESEEPYSNEPYPDSYYEGFMEDSSNPESSPYYQINYRRREGATDEYGVESVSTPWGTYNAEDLFDVERYAQAIKAREEAVKKAKSMAYDYADVDFAIAEDVRKAYTEVGGDIEEAADKAGYSMERVLTAFQRLHPDIITSMEDVSEYLLTWAEMQFPDGLPDIELNVDTSEAEEGISDVEDAEHDTTIEVDEEGAEEAKEAIDIAAKDRTSTIHVKYVFDNYTRMATGTRSHPGGLSLVNDGSGPELIVDRGRAFIAGGGKPTILNLEKGAKVFTASETRDILGGSGVPAYAMGTPNDIFGGGGITRPNTEPGDVTPDDVDPDKVNPKDDGKKDDGKKNKGGGKSSPSYKFDDLKDLIDYIIDRIGRGLDEQLEILDKQIETLKLEREQKEREDELAKKQQDLADAMNNRTVRYIDENGQWHWMADQNKVTKAQEALDKYVDELAFNAQVEAIEAQKKALQEQYNEITKAWSDIQYGVSTPTGDLNAILENLIKKGDGATKKGAETVQSLLISSLMQSGIYSGNYEEALSAISKAKAGDPIMPGESEATLASLIASASALGTGTETENAMRMTDVSRLITSGYAGTAEGGTQINYNYFINGVQIGSDQANQPLSSVLKALAVHTESSVA